VKETYQEKRTTYKVECRTETYDTVRCERVPVCKEKVVTCIKRVPTWKEETRKVCHKVTTWEDRTVNKTCYKTVQETCMQKQLVRLGHWECRTVEPLFGGNGGGLFGGHGHGGSGCCNDPCGNSCNTECCRPARTRKVWVHCPEYKECPVTVCKKVCYTVPTTCKVAVCQNVWKEEKVKVCTYSCVEEKQTVKYTCYETRQVKCQGTRTVRVCVPCESTVTCCRWVRKEVAPACAPTCDNACNTSCGRTGIFSHLRDRFNSGCCDSGCNSGCNSGCSSGHSRNCCR
jgi:hypothetical protein